MPGSAPLKSEMCSDQSVEWCSPSCPTHLAYSIKRNSRAAAPWLTSLLPRPDRISVDGIKPAAPMHLVAVFHSSGERAGASRRGGPAAATGDHTPAGTRARLTSSFSGRRLWAVWNSEKVRFT